MTRRRRGFSLIELMIVVTIIGILSAIAIPTYMGVQKKAKRSEFKVNLEVLRLLEEKAFAERGVYVAGASTDALILALTEFRPGDPARMLYEYSVVLNGTTGFTATATGKANSPDPGHGRSLNDNNLRECDPPSDCGPMGW